MSDFTFWDAMATVLLNIGTVAFEFVRFFTLPAAVMLYFVGALIALIFLGVKYIDDSLWRLAGYVLVLLVLLFLSASYGIWVSENCIPPYQWEPVNCNE